MVDWLASMTPIEGLIGDIETLEENEKEYESFDQALVILDELGEIESNG